MRKKALEKRMQRLVAKKAKIEARAAASEDVAEVRELTEQLPLTPFIMPGFYYCMHNSRDFP